MSDYQHQQLTDYQITISSFREVMKSMEITTMRNSEIAKSQLLIVQKSLDQINFDHYNIAFSALSQIKQINFNFSKSFDQIRKELSDFTKFSNQLNFDYFTFYKNSFDFEIGDFKTKEEQEIATKTEEKIEKGSVIFQETIEIIRNNSSENLLSLKPDWYTILDALKQGIENRAMKEFWDDIDKGKLKKSPEKIGQDIIDGFLHFGENILNTNDIIFRFSREDQISARGRIDFVFRLIILPFYQEIPVEIKVIQDEDQLEDYGKLQLLDYMKKRNWKKGIRLVLNATKNHDVQSFEKDNIIHYFINIWQPTSSSLN